MNNKIFDRTFVCPTTFAAFNENILNDRTFDNNEENKYRRINDKKINDRIFDLNLDVDKTSGEQYFRTIEKSNIVSKKMGDVITNPNKKYLSIVSANNMIAMKLLIYLQYYVNGTFVSSPYGILYTLLIFSLLTGDEEIQNCFKIQKTNIQQGLLQLNKLIKTHNYILINNKLKYNDKLVKNLGHVQYIDVNSYNVDNLNKIVQKNTNGYIKNILNKSDINSLTNIILVSVVYYKLKWKKSFDLNKTKPKEFTNILNTRMVNMMNIEDSFSYYENKELQLVELPYENNFCFGILLDKKINDIIVSPKPQTLNNYIVKSKHIKCNISMPKFTIDTTIEPQQFIQLAGIKQCFHKYQIKIIQKAKIIVDENGTKACAATSLICNNYCQSSPKNDIVQINANHPFVYYIRNTKTNVILFVGIYY